MFVLLESLSVVKAIVGVKWSTLFRAALICTADVVPRRACLTLEALEQEMFTAVAVWQRQECLANLLTSQPDTVITITIAQRMSYTVTEMIGIYWEQNLETIQTFSFARVGEGEVCTNAAWKWQMCSGEVAEGDVDDHILLCLWEIASYSPKTRFLYISPAPNEGDPIEK